MVHQVVTDVFETLGGVASSTGQQAVKNVKAGAEDIAKAVGVVSEGQGGTGGEGQEGEAKTSDEQMKRMKMASNRKSVSMLSKIQAEIKQIEDARTKNPANEMAKTPSIDEAKKIKQLEIQKEQKEKPEPVALQKATHKAERFRGASG